VRKKFANKTYMKGVIDSEIISINLEEEKYYLTIKKINKILKPFIVEEFGKGRIFIDDGYYIIEFTPIDRFYNVRVFIDKNLEIIGYYFDISRGNGEEDNSPYYYDLYLDIVYIPSRNNMIEVLDEDELEDALNSGKIKKEEYELARETAINLFNEIKNGENAFVKINKKEIIKRYFNKSF